MKFHYKIKYDVTREYIDINIIKEIYEFYSVKVIGHIHQVNQLITVYCIETTL